MKKYLVAGLCLVLFVTISSCGSSGGDPTGDISTASDCTGIGYTLDSDFATNGTVDLNFTCKDAAGDSVLAIYENGQYMGHNISMSAYWDEIISLALPAYVTVEVTVAGETGYTFSAPTLSSVRPTTGTDIAAALLVDNSGSMDWNDPQGERKDAAKAAVDAFCPVGNVTNYFGVFDFGQPATIQAGYSFLGVIYDQEQEDFFKVCSTDDVADAKVAIDLHVKDVGGTPLYESANELLDHMKDVSSIENMGRGIILLSDGVPNNFDNEQDVYDKCYNATARPNAPRIFTVGLGEGSEVADNKNVTAVQALKRLATQCNGAYAASMDAAGLRPIFDAMGTAIAEGFNVLKGAIKDADGEPIAAGAGEVVITVTIVGQQTIIIVFTFTV